MTTSTSLIKTCLKYLIVTAFWLIVWWVLSLIAQFSVVLPSPLVTLKELIKLAVTGGFWLSVLLSFIRITLGYILGVIIGTLFGIITSLSKSTDLFLTPLWHIIKATPVVSFIIIAVVWLNSSNVPAFISMLIVIPFIWSNVKTGINKADTNLLEMAKVYNFSKLNVIKTIYIPSLKPYFISAISTAMGLAWKAGIAAEVICYPTYSIGKGMYNSKIYLETPNLFAWTVTVVIISVILEKIMLKLLRRNSND